MLLLHDTDGHVSHRAAAAANKREENLLFLLHVLLQFGLHSLQVLGQAARARGLVTVNSLDFLGHVDEAGKLRAMRLVVAFEDSRDQFRRVDGVKPFKITGFAAFVFELRDDRGHVQICLDAGLSRGTWPWQQKSKP